MLQLASSRGILINKIDHLILLFFRAEDNLVSLHVVKYHISVYGLVK